MATMNEAEREDWLAKARRDAEAGEYISPSERLASQHANGQALRVLRGIASEKAEG